MVRLRLRFIYCNKWVVWDSRIAVAVTFVQPLRVYSLRIVAAKVSFDIPPSYGAKRLHWKFRTDTMLSV